MAVLWNEAGSGDLSDEPLNPTSLGSLSSGENIITGALPESPVEDGLDVFSFVVPQGLEVSAIFVTQLDTTGFNSGFIIFLLNGPNSTGSSVGALQTSNSGLTAGDNLFANSAFRFQGPLTAGTYTFDLRAFGTMLGANAYEFKLVALPPNIAPVANNDTATTTEDAAVTLTVLGNDRDVNGDTLSITQVNAQAVAVGSPITLASGALLTLNANSTLSFNPNGSYNSLRQGATATESFTYTISDGRRGTATATATVTIIGVNDAPNAITLSNNTVTENNAAAVIGTLTVIDPDAGDTHRFSLSDNRFEVVSGQLNQLKLKSGISLDYEAEPSVSLNVTAIDQSGLSQTQSFTIGVNDVVENTPPTDLALSATTVNENVPTGAIVGNFSTTDAEGGSFTYALVTGAGSTDNANFAIVNGNQLQINSSPDFETKSSYSIRVSTTDAGGLSYEKNLTIGVNDLAENRAPTAVNDTLSAYRNTPKTIAASTLLSNDSDPDAGTTLRIASVSNATNGSVSLNSSGDVVFTPTTADTASFQYTISDGSLTSTATATVSVGLLRNGGNGIDILLGSNNDDLLNGNDGADGLYGNKGNDLLNGGKGNDLLLGGDGNDVLNGGDNADTLFGGKGNDILTGGGGSDIFSFATGDGSDTIQDFSDGSDKIGLVGLRFNQLTVIGSGSNTLINIGTTTLATLTGVNFRLITAADFVPA